MSPEETPSCSHCGAATVPGYVCPPCEAAATDDLEAVRQHRTALDAILALCGHNPYFAECLNDPDFGETVRQAVAESLSPSTEEGTPWDATRYAYSFDVPLHDGSTVRALTWLDRNGNVRAQVDNTEYVGPSWKQVRRFIQNDPKRVHG